MRAPQESRRGRSRCAIGLQQNKLVGIVAVLVRAGALATNAVWSMCARSGESWASDSTGPLWPLEQVNYGTLTA